VTVNKLLPQHIKELENSAISPEVIQERGYTTVYGKAPLKDFGFAVYQQKAPGILIPLWGVNGTTEPINYQYKPDYPRINKGKAVKYESPTDSLNRLDCPPRCKADLANPQIPLWITEGAKKADAIATAGGCALNVGGVWNWKGKNPFGATTIQADFDSIALSERIVNLAFDSDIVSKPPVKLALLRLSEHLQRKGAVVEIIYLPQNGDKKTGIDDYLVQGHSLQDAIALPKPTAIEEPTLKPSSGFPLTDTGNAERFIGRHGRDIRYCWERGKWVVWDSHVFGWDDGAAIGKKAKDTVRTIYQEASLEKDYQLRRAIAKHAEFSESNARIEAMIARARSEDGVSITFKELDANLWLFNTQNGTVDLRTGHFREHRREDLLTQAVPYDYKPGTKCPLWEKFLFRVCGGDLGLMSYLQRVVGYSLTGSVTAQALFFLYGLGNNGKSTFLGIIRKLTGPYGWKINTDLFMVKNHAQAGHNEGLANLAGKRFVCASEIEDGKRLAVSLLKDLTGGENIRASRKHEHEIEFAPTQKYWLSGNHKPVVTDTTLSTWRRLKLIPFTVTIPDSEVDKDLPEKLEAELPGILNWARDGCLEWQRNGLQEPKSVKDATGLYRRDQDILAEFLEDYIPDPKAQTPKGELAKAYKAWCEANKEEAITQKMFKDRLLERGIGEGRVGSARFWNLRSKIASEYDTDDKCDKTCHSPDTKMTSVTEKPIKSPHEKENEKRIAENPSLLSLPDINDDKTPDFCFPDGRPVSTKDLIAQWQTLGSPAIPIPGGRVTDLSLWLKADDVDLDILAEVVSFIERQASAGASQ